jgi:hypothetical protein
MKTTSFNILTAVLLLVLTACKKNGEVTFYITNVSEYTTADSLKIYINGEQLISQGFHYSVVVPNYDIFKFNFDKEINTIKVVETVHKVEKIDTFSIKNDKFIFISFNPPGDTIRRIIGINKRKDFTKVY